MYTIREAAEKTGFSAYTLRYYERQNILPPVARDASGNRMYSEDDLNLLETIRCLKNTGMHVNDIGTFIALCREGDSTLEQRRQVMLEHKAQVEERIRYNKGPVDKVIYKPRFHAIIPARRDRR